MSEEFQFSIARMKTCSPVVPADREYLLAYIRVAGERISNGAEILSAFTDGSVMFGPDSDQKLRAAIAEVRRADWALAEAVNHFGSRPEIATRFHAPRKEHEEAITQAEQDYRRSMDYLGYRVA